MVISANRQALQAVAPQAGVALLQRSSGVAAANPAEHRNGSELIVADGLCPRIAELLPGALHEVVSMGQSANPLAAITEALAERRLQGQPVQTLHVVAHGRPGAFQIGGQWVDAAALIAHAHELAQWQVSSLALWSCEVGADQGFVALLEELTGSKTYATDRVLRRTAHARELHVHHRSNKLKTLDLSQAISKEQIANTVFSLADVGIVFGVGYIGT